MKTDDACMTTELPMYAEALAGAIAAVEPIGRVEGVPLNAALRRVLAEHIHADRDYPPFNRATMDGYAVRSSEIGQRSEYEVVGSIPAGSTGLVKAGVGQVVRIATGAPVPENFDAVIPHEQSDRSEPVRFSVESIDPWANVHLQGVDARKGAVVLERGTILGAQDLGILATVGCTQVPVETPPVVSILTSGDEIRRPEERDPAPHQIRNAGHAMLSAVAWSMGAEVHGCKHVVDDPRLTLDAVEDSADEADVIISVGGISAGERDFFRSAYEAVGARTVVQGAAIKPGKPIYIAKLQGPRARVIVALPGNPVSVLATAHLFLWPIVRRLLGLDPRLPWERKVLADAVRATGQRQSFRPCRRSEDGDRISVLPWAGSGDLLHTAASDGLAELPMGSKEQAQGTSVRFLPWSWRT